MASQKQNQKAAKSARVIRPSPNEEVSTSWPSSWEIYDKLGGAAGSQLGGISGVWIWSCTSSSSPPSMSCIEVPVSEFEAGICWGSTCSPLSWPSFFALDEFNSRLSYSISFDNCYSFILCSGLSLDLVSGCRSNRRLSFYFFRISSSFIRD